MSMNWFKSIVLLIACHAVFAQEKTDSQVINEYLKVHQQFSRALCSPGTEEKFWKLNKAFRKNTYHIPIYEENKLDVEVIKYYLPEIKSKHEWIKKQIELLRKNRTLLTLRKEIKELEGMLTQLLNHKLHFYEAQSEEPRTQARVKSKQLKEKFTQQFYRFLEKVPFFLSYNFPVNYLSFRSRYDALKFSNLTRDQRQANKIYFYRKIVEDGTQDKEHKNSDIYLRSTIDTLYLKFQNDQDDLLTEDLRADLRHVFKMMDLYLRRGKRHLLERLREWSNRVERKYAFYTNLIDSSTTEKIANSNRIIESWAQARFVLKQYVLNKQRDLYQFWAKQDETMQALYAIETILFNEVGMLDGPEALERRDIIQVILNRSYSSFYTQFASTDSLLQFLGDQETDKKWLNLLLKEGEFSFTYYFIPSSVRLFCPSQTRRARNLRRKNVTLALELLKNPNSDFKALRYFSRASMLGRIDMAQIWNNFAPIAERPGAPIKRSLAWLKARLQKGKYSYLYHFCDNQGEMFKVVELGNRNYVVSEKDQSIYSYRNPHAFKYFSPE